MQPTSKWTEKSAMFACQPPFPRLFMETSHWESLEALHSESVWGRASMLRTSSWQKQTSSVPCPNAYSFVRTSRQNLQSSVVRALASAESSTFSEKGRSKDSFRDSQKTARNKPHSAPANQVLGTREHAMLPALHTSELSLQPGGMIQGATTARLLPEQPLLARLSVSRPWRTVGDSLKKLKVARYFSLKPENDFCQSATL